MLRRISGVALVGGLLLALLPATVSANAATSVLRTGLPNRTLTPGATNPAVTQATIRTTICKSGWTATIRPPSSYTNALKVKQLVTYGFADKTLGHYEEDHLISLELGGSPSSAKNLWPEPHSIKAPDGIQVGSYAKDGFENHLKSLVCAGKITLATAQAQIRSNWVKYWRLWKGLPAAPTGSPAPAPPAAPTPPAATPRSGCDPSYPGVCIPPPPPDLNCGDIPYRNFRVLPPDPHPFDGAHDGIGCES